MFLQNITGFMVGREYEAGGIAKDGAKLVTAVACAEVPKFTVIIGGSFGAGNYGMAGRAYGSRAAVDVAQRAHQRDGRRSRRHGAVDGRAAASTTDEERDAFEAPILEKYEREGNPVLLDRAAVGRRRHRPAGHAPRAGARHRAALNAPIPETRFGVFRM